MKVNRFQGVNHRGHELFGECEGGVVFRVATDLQDTLAHLAEGHRQVGGGGAFANAAFAVNRKDLGRANLQVRVHLNLDTAFTIGSPSAFD